MLYTVAEQLEISQVICLFKCNFWQFCYFPADFSSWYIWQAWCTLPSFLDKIAIITSILNTVSLFWFLKTYWVERKFIWLICCKLEGSCSISQLTQTSFSVSQGDCAFVQIHFSYFTLHVFANSICTCISALVFYFHCALTGKYFHMRMFSYFQFYILVYHHKFL